MGGRSSRVILRYDEAVRRLGDEDAKTLERGFRRMCVGPRGTIPLDAAVFIREALWAFPNMVSNAGV